MSFDFMVGNQKLWKAYLILWTEIIQIIKIIQVINGRAESKTQVLWWPRQNSSINSLIVELRC